MIISVKAFQKGQMATLVVADEEEVIVA